MAQVRYKRGRPTFRRILRPMDLVRHGIEVDGDLVWDKTNGFTVEMSDEQSDSLVAAFPNEFEIVDFDDSIEQDEA